MLAIPLGLVVVPTSGTPVTITTGSARLPPSSQIAKIEVWPNPAAAGVVYVKLAGTILAALPVAASGAVYPWASPELDDNLLNAGLAGAAAANFS